jgi:hypothetical protein
LLAVVTLLGICLAAGAVSFDRGVRNVEARGAAQSWQAAAAWAQVSAAWSGETAALHYDGGRLSVGAQPPRGVGNLGPAAPAVPVLANVLRWRSGQGVLVRFLGVSASPDGAGSVYFQAPLKSYRVTVRVESGMTTRAPVEEIP